MVGLPRIVTVDQSGVVAQMVRSAVGLLDGAVMHIEAPTSEAAIEEVKRGDCDAVIASWEPDSTMEGWELAAHMRKISEELPIIILAHESDIDMDDETREYSPFHFIQRPVDATKFLRAMNAVFNGGDVAEALSASGSAQAQILDMGPVPHLSADATQSTINGLLTDLGALGIMLVTREGEIVLEAGAVGMLDREQLTHALLPVVTAHINVKDIVGGQAAVLQFYDGDDYDVFVLSIGLHHFMCIIFEGAVGARKLGVVNTWGWRAANDLLVMLGPDAWQIQKPRPKTQPKRKSADTEQTPEEDEVIQLDRAVGFGNNGEEEAEPEPVMQQLDPIDDLNVDELFGSDMSDVDIDFENLEALEEIARQEDRGDQIDFDTARKYGILGD